MDELLDAAINDVERACAMRRAALVTALADGDYLDTGRLDAATAAIDVAVERLSALVQMYAEVMLAELESRRTTTRPQEARDAA
jgi:hypothetical protein